MSATPEQLDDLVNFLIDFVSEALTKHGEFFPVAAIVNLDGKIEARAVLDSEEPSPSQIYELLRTSLGAEASNGAAIAAAIAVDVNMPPHLPSELSDGVRVTLETEGDSQLVYIPYAPAKRGLFSKAPPKFKDPIIVDTSPAIFVSSAT